MKHILNYIRPFLNWRFLISYSIPWFFTNGWAWIGTLLIPFIGVNAFTGAASAWLTFLWMPWTPEKVVIIPAAIWIHSVLFKNDPKTHAQLVHMRHQALHDLLQIKKQWRKINGRKQNRNN